MYITFHCHSILIVEQRPTPDMQPTPDVQPTPGVRRPLRCGHCTPLLRVINDVEDRIPRVYIGPRRKRLCWGLTKGNITSAKARGIFKVAGVPYPPQILQRCRASCASHPRNAKKAPPNLSFHRQHLLCVFLPARLHSSPIRLK